MILSNTTNLHENEPCLTQLDIPDEFLACRRLKLSDGEATEVAMDFAVAGSSAAQTQLKIHGHLFHLSKDVALELAVMHAPEA